MGFLTFKLNTRDVIEAEAEIAKIRKPDYFKITVYAKRNPRISELNFDVLKPPMMVNLNMSWEQYHKILDKLIEVEKHLETQVINVMGMFKARMRDYGSEAWVQL